MTSGEALDQLRSDLDDVEKPYLWTDQELFRYIDSAQKELCRRTDGIPDATTASVTQLAITPNASYLGLDPSIQKIRAVSRLDDGRPVEVVNFEDLPARGMYFDGRAGRVRALVIGEQEAIARTWPLSSETVTLKLLVFRLPLVDIVDDQAFEVLPVHHLHLLHWAKRCAYMKQDADAFDKIKANDFEQRFIAYCAEAQEEERRKAHKPRTVAYGGL